MVHLTLNSTGWKGWSATCTRAVAQALDEVAIRPTSYHHIKAHCGDKWNELADATAKATLEGSLPSNCPDNFRWHEWLTGQAHLRIEKIPTCLAFLRGDPSLPAYKDKVITWSTQLAPPTVEVLWPHWHRGGDTYGSFNREQLHQLKCCTFNVRTLKDDPLATTTGACEFLRAQFSYYRYQIVALQEIRAKVSTVCDTPDYIRIVAAGKAGHDGCELWFSKQHPLYGTEMCTLQHITVVHQEPSLLAVRLRTGNQFLIVISAHAPHSGRSVEDRKQWWNGLEQLLQRFHDRGKILVLGDFNAQLGEEFPPSTGSILDKVTTQNGQALANLSLRYGLWIPSTFSDVHIGPTGTWQHPSSKDDIRLDYHLVDQTPTTWSRLHLD